MLAMAHMLIDIVVFALSVFVCTASDSSPFGSGEVAAALTNCESMTESKLKAYFGWPVFLSCDELYWDWLYPVGPAELTTTATCTIRALPSAEVVSNKTYDLNSHETDKDIRKGALVLNVTEELPSNFVVKFEVENYCFYQVVELNKTQLPTTDCYNVTDVVDYDANFGMLQKLPCKKAIPFGDSASFNWRWTFNCGDALPKYATPNGHELHLLNVSYEDVGKFTCYAVYNGKETPVRQFDVCIDYKWETSKPIPVRCPENVAVRLGDDVTIECIADAGTGKIPKFHINGAWYRGQNFTEEICDGVEGEIRDSEADGSRIQCSMKSSMEKNKCYKVEPTERQRIDSYTMNLTIKNVNASDFGTYRLEVGELAVSQNTYVTLQRDMTDERRAKVTGITVAVCFLALILLILLLCRWRKYDVLWFWKKNFGPYEKEFLTYTAFFAYYFDVGKMEKESMKQTKSLVEKLHDFMDKFGGTVFDEQRDPNVHNFDTNNILQVQSECHRIILVISPGFVTDEWSRIVTDLSLDEVVESGRKAIFITMPGTEEAISILDEKPKRTLVAAMKRNITIHWDGKIPLSGSLRRRLEYALPKLPKPGYNRYLSDSSQAQLTHHNKNADKYVRTSNGGYENGFGSIV